MSSFSLHCTTCKSRLKVRDRSAIGQIVACPKCGSMVMIEAPGDPAANPSLPEALSAASAAMPDTVADSKLGAAFEEAASWFDDEQPAASAADTPASPAAQATEPAAVAPADQPPADVPPAGSMPAEASPPSAPLFSEQPPEKPVPAKTTRPHVTPPPPPPGEQAAAYDANQPLLPGDAWLSGAGHTRRRVALVAGAAVLGIASVVGLALLVSSGGKTTSDDSRPVAHQAEAQQAAPLPDDQQSGDQPQSPPPEPAAPTESDEQPATSVPPPPADEVEPTDEPPLPPAETVETPRAPPVVPAVEPETVPPAEAIVQPNATADDEAPVAASPPPDNPATAEPPLFASNGAQTPPAGVDSGLAALDALLPFLDAPLDDDAGAAADAPTTGGERPPEAPADAAAEPEELAELPPVKPEPRTVDLAARWNDPIEAIEFPNVPLLELVRMLSEFSAVPITLDPDAMAQYKIRPDDPVSVIMGRTTFGEVLEKAVGRLHLQVERGDGQLVITRNRHADGSLRQARYSVSDLLTEGQSLAELRRLAIAHVAPGSWSDSGGEGTLEAAPGALLARHTEPVHHQLVLFFERLRIARGLPPRSSYNPLLFDTRGRVAAWEDKLAQSISLNYFEPTPLLRIVRRLEETAGIRILINWQALLAAGWTPDTEATLTAADIPLDEALERLLGPRDLIYRVVDQETIQITTAEFLQSTREVEFHRVAELLEQKQWSAGDLQAELLAGLHLEDGAVRTILGFDEVGSSLVVSASPLVQDRIRSLLGELRDTLASR